MTVPTRNFIIYSLLSALWLLTAGWQITEHQRVRTSARAAMVGRAQDTAAALSVVIRSQGRFGMAPLSRIIMALEELVDSTELTSVALLNAANDIVATAGAPMDTDIASLMVQREHWREDYATFLNLVALGPNADTGEASHPPSVVIDTEEHEGRGGPPAPFLDGLDPFRESLLTEDQRLALLAFMDKEPLTAEQAEQVLALIPGETPTGTRRESCLRLLVGRPLTSATLGDVTTLLRRGPPPWHRGRGRNRPEDDFLRRPPWLGETEFNRLIEARGVHWFIVTMPVHAVRAEIARDIRLRLLAAGVALLACLAVGWAWRTFSRAADLQLRLVRAEDLAAHLRDLNMAAAGLVHETRNPLNIIRGLAQIVARERSTPNPIRDITVKITEESDRITERLNRFLDYSRPLDPQYAPVPIRDMIEKITDILECDRIDKALRFEVVAPPVTVLADEDMLRQTIFNLLLNAIQAAPAGSVVRISVLPPVNGTTALEIRDDGPGVPIADQEEIFRPYFTTSPNGSGLGLTVVRQFVLAHHWEVRYVPGDRGALFRVGGIRIAETKDHRCDRSP